MIEGQCEIRQRWWLLVWHWDKCTDRLFADVFNESCTVNGPSAEAFASMIESNSSLILLPSQVSFHTLFYGSEPVSGVCCFSVLVVKCSPRSIWLFWCLQCCFQKQLLKQLLNTIIRQNYFTRNCSCKSTR